jgi:hypothetical protein
MAQNDVDQVWLPIIGKCLAFACMHSAEIHDKTIVEKARFLEALGLERKDVALMLDTTRASITEMYRQSERRKGGKRARTKRAKRR